MLFYLNQSSHGFVFRNMIYVEKKQDPVPAFSIVEEAWESTPHPMIFEPPPIKTSGSISTFIKEASPSLLPLPPPRPPTLKREAPFQEMVPKKRS